MICNKLTNLTFALAAMIAIPATTAWACHHEEAKSADHDVVETADAQTTDMNIVETAASNEDFSTLVTAIQTAGLVDALSNEDGDPLTVFAPTNAAFEKLPEGTLDALLNEEGYTTLTAILLYHVSPGKTMAKDVVQADHVDTLLEGQTLAIEATEEGVMINGAKVIVTDIHCTNGVIHVIDAVLIPSDG